MFGSKTTRLMSDIDRALYKGRQVVAFKANKDKRYTKETISTHTGATYPAFCIDHAEEILYYVNENIHNSNQDAYFTEAMFDINNATAEERVGSFGMYEPRCAKHYSTFKE